MDYLKQVHRAGVIGCGGAGFPTDVKLAAQAEHLIVNGVECEPLLTTDRYLLRHFADDIVRGLTAAACQVGAQKMTIALKAAYKEEIEALRIAIEKQGADIRLHALESFYPAGDEQVVVREVTGRTVPPGGIPLDVGVVVCNAATILAVSEALQDKPFTHRYLTVAGEVYSPTIVRAPVGTPMTECVRLAGGARRERYILVNGGPLMGKVIPFEFRQEAFVEKTTSGILVLPEDSPVANSMQADFQKLRRRAASSCIQCSYCTMLCPRYLLGHPLEPHKLMRLFALNTNPAELPDSPLLRSAALCSLCGVCSLFACPMGLAPNKVNAELKAELARRGLRYQKQSSSENSLPGMGRNSYCQENNAELREGRKVPVDRLAARAGVRRYETGVVDSLTEAYPQVVKLRLSQGAGAAAQALVSPAQRVHEGQLIASPQAGTLGANLHASIDGIVLSVDEAVVIKGV